MFLQGITGYLFNFIFCKHSNTPVAEKALFDIHSYITPDEFEDNTGNANEEKVNIKNAYAAIEKKMNNQPPGWKFNFEKVKQY